MKLGLIGAGNMASALARGWVSPRSFPTSTPHGRGAGDGARREAVGSNAELAERADVVVLCHKPAQLDEVAERDRRQRDGGRRRSWRHPHRTLEAAYPGTAGLPLHARTCRPRCGRGRALLRRPAPRPPRAPRARCSSCSAASARSSAPRRAADRPAMAIMSCGPAFIALVAEALRRRRRGARPRARRRPPHGRRDHGRHGALLARARRRPGGAPHARWPRPAGHRARPAGARGRGPRAALPTPRSTPWWRARAMTSCSPSPAWTSRTTSRRCSRLPGPDLHPDHAQLVPRIPYNRVLSAVLSFVNDVTDPYLNLFRRIIPPVRHRPGARSTSARSSRIFVLIIVGRIVVGLDPRAELGCARPRGRAGHGGRGRGARPGRRRRSRSPRSSAGSSERLPRAST